jgi:16S rRNA (cytosine967-C5)-methyltransferase
MAGGSHLAQTLEISGFPSEDMFFGNRPERFGCKSQIHRVACFVWEINRESRKNGINSLDSAKPPTSVHAKTAVGQLDERFYMLSLQLPCQRHFLEFFFHKILVSRFPLGNPLLKIVTGEKPREIAIRILDQALGPGFPKSGADPDNVKQTGGFFLENLLERAFKQSQLTAVDRRLCQELVSGIVRWKATLAWLVEQKTRQAPAPRLRNLLFLGLYQIFWLDRIPGHAAVHETVELAKKSGFGAQAGFVNALLRGYLREFEHTRKRLVQLKTTNPDIGFSHPAWLVSRWEKRWGMKTVAQLMDWNNTPPKTFARVNLLKADPGSLVTEWRAEGVEYDFARKDWIEENSVFELKSHPPIHLLPSFQKGWFYVQDPSTLLAVQILSPRPGESILDLCAAPGGKLAYIAQRMTNEGRLAAYDLSSDRMELVKENCARLGITRVEMLSDLGQNSRLENQFDRILIDAPCSNTGVMRRRVDLRWRIREEAIQRLRSVQLDLLRQAVFMLKPRGSILYSTCSLETEENQEVVAQFLRENNQFKIEEERQLLPFRDQVDGAYVAMLKSV